MTDEQAYSRITATAAALGNHAQDHHRFLDKRVLLTGEAEALATENGRECLMGALLQLPRICANIVVALPEGAVRDEARRTAERVAFGHPLAFVDPPGDGTSFDSILNVGRRARVDLPWTAIISDGWLVRVTSGARDLPAPTGGSNPISALAAASLGMAETFKRLLGVRASRGPMLEDLCWNLYSYSTGSSDLGPALPPELPLEILLAGAGAIGNAVVHLLTRLPIRGRVSIIDAQGFSPENLGTCLLIGPADIGVAKAQVLADHLRAAAKVQAEPFHETLDEFSKLRLGRDLPYPRIVLGALDNIDARHALQDLWPDLLIDGAIGPVSCQVSRHPHQGDSACCRCLFRQPPGERAEIIASRVTGLTPLRAQADDVVMADDLAAAPADKREWLAQRVGKPICSVVTEAVARDLTDTRHDHFEPSVPFVACLSASMMVAELVKAVGGFDSVLDPRFQFDVLRGPGRGELLPQERRRDCLCTTRATTIRAWREQRSLSSVASYSTR